MVETQKYLFEHSAELPEGLYLALMNKLKIDYDNGVVKIVYRYPIKQYVQMNKSDMLQMIIDETIGYPDRDNILKRIVIMTAIQLRRYCRTNSWEVTKKNPKFIE